MSNYSERKWKYATIGLAAILVMVVTTPAAYAADKSHQDILNALNAAKNSILAAITGVQTDTTAIKANTNNLPEDPADQSLIDSQLGSLQADTDDIQAQLGGLSLGGASPKSVQTNMILDPPENRLAFWVILPAESGKTYSGTISGHYVLSEGNRGHLACRVGGAFQSGILLVDLVKNLQPNTNMGNFNEPFTCNSLTFEIIDLLDDSDAGGAQLQSTAQYFESTDVTVID